MAKQAPNVIQPESLMLFTKSKLLFFSLSCVIMGIVFFGVGFLAGYKSGSAKIVEKYALAKMDIIDRESGAVVVQKDQKYQFLVHTGLFSSLPKALSNWQEVESYSPLSEKQAIVQVKFNKQDFYQVLLGVFDTQEQADNFAQIISTKNTKGLIPIIKKIPSNQSSIKHDDDKKTEKQDKTPPQTKTDEKAIP